MSLPELHAVKRLMLRRFKDYDKRGFDVEVERVHEPGHLELHVQFDVGPSTYRIECHEQERSLDVRLRHATGSDTWNTIKRLPFRGDLNSLGKLIDRLFYIAA